MRNMFNYPQQGGQQATAEAPEKPASETIKEFAALVSDQMLAKSNGNGMHQKDVAAAHTGTLLHGPGGLFNTAGLMEPIISLHVRSRGLGQLLPAFPSNFTDPRYGFLVGIAAESGDEPVNPCDPAPTGYMKSGTLTARFGHIARDTKTIRLPDTISQLHRGDFTDLMLVNSVLNPESSGVYYPGNISEGQMIDMVVNAEQVIVGTNLERKLSKMLWTGDASVSTAQEGYVEFPGLDSQIATGQVDAETNVAIPAADSLILDWGYQELGVGDFVEPLSEAEDYIDDLAFNTGVDVDGVIVMHPNAWRQISNSWPIQYNTQPNLTALGGGNAQFIIDGRTMVDQRDQMRNGLYIDINSRRYNVVLDHGIVQEDFSTNSTDLAVNEYASAIYFIPLTMSGLPITYWEYKNHLLSVAAGSSLPANMVTWWTDGGRFLWSMDSKHTCFVLKAETDPRIVLRTPHLAFKIQNVKYRRTYTTLRDPDPTSSYWKDGGVSIRNLAPTNNAVWK